MNRLLLQTLCLVLLAAGLAFLPWRNDRLLRRAAWLLLLPAPALTLLALGPAGFVRAPYDAAQQELMLSAQTVGVCTSVILATVLLVALSGIRRATLAIGLLMVFGAVEVAGLNELIIAPGS